MITADIIKNHLSDKNSNINVYVYDCVSSTNDLAKEYAANNYTEAVFVARKQTAGRGRRGRSFFSPDSTGLYMSILLHPTCSVDSYTLLTPAAAVATAKAIEKVSDKKVDIKWINDIYLDGKKMCGILCESSFNRDSSASFVVVGIGINLCTPEGGFPEEISNIATSLFGNKLPDENVESLLCSEIVNNVVEYFENIEGRSFMEEYKRKMFLLGKEITVISSNETYPVIATDISPDAHLIVTLRDNSTKVLNSGEISIRSYQTK